MKITDLTLTLFAWDDIPVLSYGAHSGTLQQGSKLGLLAIETDAGITGPAFPGSAMYPADMAAAALIPFLKPIVLGQDPMNRELLNQRMWKRGRNTSVRSIGAIDVALWDIAGKAANLPIYQMLGGYRDRIPAYPSSAGLSGPQAYAGAAGKFRDAGWASDKSHPRPAWMEGIVTCEAGRKAVGPGYRLRLN